MYVLFRFVRDQEEYNIYTLIYTPMRIQVKRHLPESRTTVTNSETEPWMTYAR